jgi:hypothetical protein
VHLAHAARELGQQQSQGAVEALTVHRGGNVELTPLDFGTVHQINVFVWQNILKD